LPKAKNKTRKKERSKAARLCNSSRNQCIEKWWSAKKGHMNLVNKQTKTTIVEDTEMG
jgi:hypothetical protein